MQKLHPKAIYSFWYTNFLLPLLPLFIIMAIIHVMLLPRNLLKIGVITVIIVIGLIFLYGFTSSEIFVGSKFLIKESFNLLIQNFKSWVNRIFPFAPIIGLGTFIWAALSYGWAWLEYYFYSYEIGKENIKIEKGIIRKKYISIPYNKVQNIEIKRYFIDRILGLSMVYVTTAGPKGGLLPVLSVEEAEKFKNEIIKKVEEIKKQESTQQPYAKITP